MKQKKLLAVVTGACRGIGQAIVEELLNAGYEVIGTGRNEDPGLVNMKYFQVDFLNDGSTQNFISSLKKREVDILVNNAGINKVDKFTKIKAQDFDEILRVNLKTPFLLSQTVIPGMTKRKWGRIVNITSIFSQISKEGRASYSASKFGLDGLTAAMSAELSSEGILVNSVGPGIVDTDLTSKILGKKGKEQIVKKIPIGRMGNPQEIAKLVAWLVSEENTYISGQNIIIDGGFSRV